MIQVRAKIADEFKHVFDDGQFIDVKSNDVRAKKTLLLWLWIQGGGAWVSRHPTGARRLMEETFALYPRLPKSRVSFLTPVQVGFREFDNAVIDDPASINGIIEWTQSNVHGKVRTLSPAADTREYSIIDLPADELWDLLELERAGKSTGYDEWDLIRSVTSKSLYYFVREFWSTVVSEPFVDNWHIRYLCDEIDKVSERVRKFQPKEYDLIINISPGSTKSIITSVMQPAQDWAVMPSQRFIGGSYANTLAMDLSRKNRDLVRSAKYQKCFPTRIKADQDAKSFFMNESGGMRLGIGTGGIAGFHAHKICVDDPLDPNKAVSEVELKNADDWIKSGLSQRKIDQAITPMEIIMQRLHEDDPTGCMLKRNADGVKHICIPAEQTDNVKPRELVSFYIDGLMDPRRLNKQTLAEKRKLGQFLYSGQYLQSPTPPEGGMFKVDRIEVWNKLPDHLLRVVRYWDYAGTQDDGCFTAGVKMCSVKIGSITKVGIIHVVRGQWDTARRDAVVKQTAQIDGSEVPIRIEQEPGSAGLSVIDGAVRALKGYRVKGDKPTGDKVWRADPFSAWVNAGDVFMLRGEWNQDFIDELRVFPMAKIKDQVDAASGGFNFVIKRKRVAKGGW